MNPAQLVASTRPVFGQSFLDKRSDLQLMEQFAEAGEIERWLQSMCDCGVRKLITPMDERMLSVLQKRHDLQIEVIPLIPNVMGLVREATEYGMMGAGMRLVWRMGFGAMTRLGLRSVPKAMNVLKRDFPTMLSILFDLELSLFREFKPQRALMNPQIADLMLAMGNERIFHDFAGLARQRYKIEPGIATNNFGSLARSFETWQPHIRLILTPVNQEGWQMKPSKDSCEAYLASASFDVIADRIAITPPPVAEQIDYAMSFPAVREAAVDVADWRHIAATPTGLASS